MAENKQKKQQKSPLIGVQAQPTILDNTTKIDIDVNKTFAETIIEAGLAGGLDIGSLEEFTSISNARDQIYTMIDTMMADSSVSSIVKTYAEEVCDVSDNGHIVWCESTDSNVSKFVNYLLNVMNVDKNIFGWAYSLLKYGDLYLKLYRESDYDDKLFSKDKVNTVVSARSALNEDINSNLDEAVNVNIRRMNDQYSYYIEAVADPGTMFELTKYGRTYGYVETPNSENSMNYLNSYTDNQVANGVVSYRMKSNDVNIYQADDYVHACLEDNFSRFPERVNIFLNENDYSSNTNSQQYTVRRGKSLLYDAYKVWREKTLLENAILLNRLTKSSIVRNIQIEVGDMPKSQATSVVRRVKELFEQKSAFNAGNNMSEYNNPSPLENNIFTTTHNGKGAISVNSVGGDVEVKNLADLDEWINKFYSAFGIPKAYYGYTDDGAGFNGGTSLAIISSVFAKGVKRVQNSLIQAITDAVNLICINKGCKAYINNFVIKMKAPLSQEEKDYRENLTNRVSAISNIQSLFADVEDKERKLEILKVLLGTLNYGDDLVSIIDEEINATRKAAEEEAKQAEAEGNDENDTKANDAADTNSSDDGLGAPNDTAEEDNGIDIDSIDLGSAADIPMESFKSTGSTQLVEGPDFSDDSEDLPTPEEVNEHIDFTKNN